MRWLEQLQNFLDIEFQNPNWADELNPNLDLVEFTTNLVEKEKDVLIKVFEFLNLSVLESEYVFNKTVFDEKLKEIHSKVGVLQGSLMTTDNDDFLFSKALSDQQFLFSFKKALEVYKRISDNVNKQISNLHKTIVLDISDTFDGTNKYFTSKDDVLTESLFDLFYINISLSRASFFLENYNSEFKDLLETKDVLKKLKTKINYPETCYNQIIDILIESATFFQRKIIIRITQDETRYNDGYIYNLNEYSFSLDQHPLMFDYFKKWDNYSQNHFLSEDNKEKETIIKRLAEEILTETRDSSTFTFFQTHCLIKYYKDLKKDLTDLEKLITIFENYEPKSDFDRLALNVSKNYLMNNILSLKINNINFSDIDNLISEYRKLQESSLVNNFFPYFKICSFLKKYIETNISIEELKIENLTNVEIALEKLKICFKLYKKNVQWSENHLYYAYQLPCEEAKININLKKGEEDITLSYFTSLGFSLSIDYTKYKDSLKEIESFILNFDNQIKSLKNIYSSTNKLIEKQTEIQAQLKEQEKKNLELLGIFSAIIALLFQGVNTAGSTESIQYKLITFICMFVVLFSFLFMIRIFFNKEEKIERMSKWFEMSVFILMFVVLILLYSTK
ncbi:hypothetical protein [Flavobacterium sp. KACC 22761]|uniref:hypothetical protein n=1 Tax=Flavobacterium sp. KACC 22761 TaxID=3092665 RepID=UPI002A751845|nr:hypothetical protein [Flavobacterium sp. KACC 22761]WPO80030.1 hypothetical protein SCB73_06525 [Flavobacterium sp. KACC 22761]